MTNRYLSTPAVVQTENLFILRQSGSIYQSSATEQNHYKHSNHSAQRADQRGVSDEVLKLVITYGKLIRKQGLKFYVGFTKNFPKNIDHNLVEKSSDVVVVVSGFEIVTCYKNAKAIKRIKKKSDRLAKR